MSQRLHRRFWWEARSLTRSSTRTPRPRRRSPAGLPPQIAMSRLRKDKIAVVCGVHRAAHRARRGLRQRHQQRAAHHQRGERQVRAAQLRRARLLQLPAAGVRAAQRRLHHGRTRWASRRTRRPTTSRPCSWGCATRCSSRPSPPSITTMIGLTVGLMAGFSRGMLDRVLSFIIDLFLSFPFILFALAVAPIITQRFATEPDTLARAQLFSLVIVLSTLSWMGLARLVRGQILQLREREFILAAQVRRRVDAADPVQGAAAQPGGDPGGRHLDLRAGVHRRRGRPVVPRPRPATTPWASSSRPAPSTTTPTRSSCGCRSSVVVVLVLALNLLATRSETPSTPRLAGDSPPEEKQQHYERWKRDAVEETVCRRRGRSLLATLAACGGRRRQQVGRDRATATRSTSPSSPAAAWTRRPLWPAGRSRVPRRAAPSTSSGSPTTCRRRSTPAASTTPTSISITGQPARAVADAVEVRRRGEEHGPRPRPRRRTSDHRTRTSPSGPSTSSRGSSTPTVTRSRRRTSPTRCRPPSTATPSPTARPTTSSVC